MINVLCVGASDLSVQVVSRKWSLSASGLSVQVVSQCKWSLSASGLSVQVPEC